MTTLPHPIQAKSTANDFTMNEISLSITCTSYLGENRYFNTNVVINMQNVDFTATARPEIKSLITTCISTCNRTSYSLKKLRVFKI